MCLEAVKCSEQASQGLVPNLNLFKDLCLETDESRWKFNMRHWHSRRVVGRFRAAGALMGNRMDGLVRRPPGAQNSSSAKDLSSVTRILEEGLSHHNFPLSYKVSLGPDTTVPEAKNVLAPHLACLFRCHCWRVAGSRPARCLPYLPMLTMTHTGWKW